MILVELSDSFQSPENAAGEGITPAPEDAPPFDVSVTASFPSAEIFGPKIINGQGTHALLDITNNEGAPITLVMVGGMLSRPETDLKPGAHASSLIVRNLTTTKYTVEVPAGAKESLPYTFTTDMQPADLQLSLMAIFTDNKGNLRQVPAFHDTVSVVEAPTSFLDPQMYAHPLQKQATIEPLLTDHPASSFTLCWPQRPRERSTSSTRPGSRHSSHKRSVVAREASVRAARWPVPRRPCQLRNS